MKRRCKDERCFLGYTQKYTADFLIQHNCDLCNPIKIFNKDCEYCKGDKYIIRDSSFIEQKLVGYLKISSPCICTKKKSLLRLIDEN